MKLIKDGRPLIVLSVICVILCRESVQLEADVLHLKDAVQLLQFSSRLLMLFSGP